MHRFLTEHPVYKQALVEVARIQSAHSRHQQKLSKAEQEYRAAAAEYQQKAVEALRDGREAPERPTPPEVDVELVQRLAIDAIQSDGILRKAQRDLAPELLPKLEQRALEIEESIRQAADTMRGLAREASELRVTASAHRAAAEFPPLLDPGAVDVAHLFALVVRGDRLLEARSASDAAGVDWNAQRPAQRGFSSVLDGRR